MDPALNQRRLGLLIPNWNGEAFIEQCLAAVREAVAACGQPVQCLIIDDASADRSPDLIESAFPEMRLVRQSPNRGFGATVNRGMRELDCDWVFLLNNDLAPRPDFCTRLLQTLGERDEAHVFAIGARTVEWDSDAINHGGQRAVWRRGMIVQEAFEADACAETGFFQAGACLIDRRKFLALGGFADIFHPGYWEDYDLAWQARRRGWVSFYEPRAIGRHVGKGSMSKLLGERRLARVIKRNHLLFVWVSLTDRGLIRRHILSLPGRVALGWVRPRPVGWLRPLLGALARWPMVRRLRGQRLSSPAARSDRELLGGPAASDQAARNPLDGD